MSAPVLPDADEIDRVVRAALDEDLGDVGDLTTALLVPETARGRGVLRAEEPLVAAGVPIALRVFTMLDPGIRQAGGAHDGDRVPTGGDLLRVEGAVRALLTAERSALNFLGRLSGVATASRRAVEAAAGTPVRIYDTRKTTPGLRALEKYAVRCGGAENHRVGLHDMALVKENHIAVVGSVGEAVRQARAGLPTGAHLQVEVTDLGELEEAIAAGANLVLLDNMDRETMAEAVRQVAGRAELEASGGIEPSEVGALARATGVDRISVGALTRSAPWAEVSMDLEILPAADDVR